MLLITIPVQPDKELFDDETEQFITIPSPVKKEVHLQLEHSLISLSKWESKWHKPFLGIGEKTLEETIDYVRCMALTQNVNPDIFNWLTNENVKEINDYIANSMTATTFNDNSPGKINREIITSELIYYWMTTLGIPFECEKWHLNRLITLIKVCNIKNQPAKKMGRGDVMRRNASLNAARRQQLNTKG